MAEVFDIHAYRDARATGSVVTPGLKEGGGGGTLPPVEIVDAKIAAAEARTDTKFAELRGELKLLPTKATVWGAVATGVALILAALAFAGDRFDTGMSIGAQTQTIVSEQHKRDDAQDKKLDEILRRLPKPEAAPASHK